MPSFKPRRQLVPQGGLTVGDTTISTTGALSTASLNVTSGSTTICASGFAVGGGTKVSKIVFARTSVIATSTAAASSVTAAITVANLATTDSVFVMCGSTAACLLFTGASPTAASVLTLRFYNAASDASIDNPISVQYIVLA